MNKLFKLFSIIALSSSVMFVSCKGDTGPQGPAGPAGANGTNGTNGTSGTNGKDGNANVVSHTVTVAADKWTKTSVAGIGTASASEDWGNYSVKDSTVTNDKAVWAWVKSGDTWVALPVMLTKDIDGSIERINVAYQTGQVNFMYRYQTKLFDGITKTSPDNALTFKYIVIQNTLGAAMKNSGVNLRNLDSVEKFIQSGNM